MEEFFGPTYNIDNLSTFEGWHRWGEYCQSYGKGEWANKTARSTLIGSRSFMNWLFKTKRLSELPTNFDDYRIRKETKTPKVFTDEEMKLILSSADDELNAYILLALNTGANQIDIAELKYAKNDKALGLCKGTVRRKRVKTEGHENVPIVRYNLWHRTQQAINKYKCQEGEYVFRTEQGNILVSRTRGEDGKLKNNDSLGLRFRRLMERLKIEGKSFKTLRATAASKLGNNKKYRVFGPLFLGQAPDGVYEQHYLNEDCKELNEGVKWLEGQFFKK